MPATVPEPTAPAVLRFVLVSLVPAELSGVVFDCDGLLVDTESRWTIAETAVFAEHGFPFGADEKAMLIGRSVEEAAPELAEYFGRPGEGDAIAADLLERVHREVEKSAEALPGALELVRICAERVPVIVASNSPHSLVDLALKPSGLGELLPLRVTAEDVERPKPAPDLFLEACRRVGAAPAASVAFEDSGTGTRSARAAGLYVVGVPSLPGAELDCNWQLSSLADPELVAWAEALPPA
jgi:HAD superfamily hydrolase (TIGR01509 family)